jgi:uncharacterized RDD family membrane protein YckC
MESISIETSQNVRIDYRLASIGERIGAYLLDGLLIIGYMVLAFLLFALLNRIISGGGIGVVPVFLMYLPVFFYNLICEVFFNGASFGKRQMDIKVVKVDGSQPTLGAYILRWMFRIIDIPFYGAVAILAILIGGKGQRLGDMAAGTAVVGFSRKTSSLRSQFMKVNTEAYTPVYPQVMQLTDTDIALVRESLRVYKTSGNSQPVKMVAQKVKELLGIVSEKPPLIVLETLLKDYEYLSVKA